VSTTATRDDLLRKALARLDALEARAREPIAITGMACRFPGGANDPDAFWNLLVEGRDAVARVPSDRWDADALYDADPNALGKIVTREGAFLDGIDRFDAEFFGITPREARAMDPQQRILLEVAWEALEHAGYRPDAVPGMAGVFIGIASNNYAQLLTTAGEIDAYGGLGAALSAAPGRIAYTLGLTGPTVALDAACASSLAAVHLACQALRDGECDVALAGGVNAILTPFGHQFLSRAKVLSPDGRCKSFSAAADGIGRGEGCGIVVLKRLADARRDGDTVLAALLGSAVEQDGRSSGLTVPNGVAQARLLRQALRRAGLAPAAVDAIEAHGTGTPLGDPIEAEALGEVFGSGRPADRPLVVGSVKTNLAHLEAAAGIAGLIKMVLALQHDTLPPLLHQGAPNPRLDWRSLPVELPRRPRPWPRHGRQRAAGVSAFGLTGTIAHIVLGDPPTAPAVVDPTAAEPDLHVLPLSARSPTALKTLQARHQRALEQAEISLSDYCFTAGVGRKPQPYRLAVTGRDTRSLQAALAEAVPVLAEARPRLAFLFTGQGAHWHGMGAALLAREPVFRATVERCAAALAQEPAFRNRSLLDLLDSDPEGLDNTALAQPALFALQAGLVALWKTWGVVADVVLGHSAGEIAAAAAAGLIGIEDGVRFAARRGAAMADMPSGTMATVFAPAPEVAAAIAARRLSLSIAACNGPSETVVSGDATAIAALANGGPKTKALAVAYAFHSAHVDPVLERISAAAGFLAQRPAERALLCNLDGLTLAPGQRLPRDYWSRQAREPVAFDRALLALAAAVPSACIEIGPRPTLLPLVRRSGEGLAGIPCLPSLRADDTGLDTLRQSVAALYRVGVPIDWAGLHHGRNRRRIALPTTPFESRRHWIEVTPKQAVVQPVPLPGARTDSPLGDWHFETVLEPNRDAVLDQHRLQGVATYPAAALLTLAREAAAASNLDWPPAIAAMRLVAPLQFPGDQPRIVRTALAPNLAPDGSELRLVIASKPASPTMEREPWTVHAEARLVRRESPPGGTFPTGLALSPVTPDLFAAAAAAGVSLGLLYRRLVRFGPCEGGMAGEVDTGGETVLTAPLLDACFQVAAAAIREEGLWIPAGLERAIVPAAVGGLLRVIARATSATAYERRFSVALHDAGGALIGTVDGLTFRRGAKALPSAPVYQLAWQAMPRSARAVGPVLVTGDRAGRIVSLLSREGIVTVDRMDAAKAVLWAPSADAPDLLTGAAKAAVEGRAHPGVRLWLLAEVGRQSPVAAGALRGMAATLAVEQSDHWGGLIEYDENADPATVAPALAAALAGDEPLVAIRNGELQIPRLTRAALPEEQVVFTSDDAWLVTGGFGGIGRHIARALSETGLRRLVLMTRTVPADANDYAAELKVRGTEVMIESADVTDRAALAAVLDRVARRGWQLTGVAHLAAVGDGKLLAHRDPASLAAIAAPKTAGAWNLHLLTAQLPLQHFVLFSSLSAVLGVPGQAGYAAGNAFMDALARHRRERRLPAVSIAWDAWASTGLAAKIPSTQAGRQLDPQVAAALFLRLAAGASGPNPIVSALDFGAYARAVPQAARLLDAFVRTVPAAAASAPLSLSGTLADRRRALLTELGRVAAKVMLLPAGEAVPTSSSLFEAGLDSLMATELAAELSRRLGRPIPATIAYDFPTLALLADHFAATTVDATADAAPTDGLEDRIRTLTDAEIAAEITARFAMEDPHG
jgi:acyl transferase domain-containing protein/NADP-dependent 3-hydroxy acid dehydrogenase YdfG/acyl carrier protein